MMFRREQNRSRKNKFIKAFRNLAFQFTGMSLTERDLRYIWHPYTQMKDAVVIGIARGEGAYLYDEDGKKYIDAVSSWWVNTHGHANPYISQKISAQLNMLEHVIFAGFTHQPAVELAERLLSHLPENQKKIFFSDNGSTAVEVALKMALQYWSNKGLKKNKIIAFRNAYHGDTFGAMSVSGRSVFTDAFKEFLFDVIFIETPVKGNEERSFEELKIAVFKDEPAAFIFEPLVQGASGMIMYDASILDRMIKFCQEQKVITIADEVMTGFYRTGKFFATDHCVSKPDIFCLSKGITGGFMPLGVTACSAEIFNAFISEDKLKTLYHGHSYTANPLSCTAALASLDLYEKEECPENVKRISEKHAVFYKEINGHASVRNARMLGTVLAIELETSGNTDYLSSVRDKAYNFFLGKGIIMRPLGNVIYVLPPYCISNDDLDYIYDAVRIFLNEHLK
jgi:adenosylmethionine---8-amino-7-oxononanoate aminotransferase